MTKGNAFFNFLRGIIIWTSLDRYFTYLTKGSLSTSILGRLAPNNYQYKKGTYRSVQTKNNIKLSLDLHDYLGHYIYFGYKDPSQEALLNIVEEDYFVFDIGTNIGNTILELANKVKPGGKVIGFEPDPETYGYCLKNIELNKFENVQVHNIGLGDCNSSFFIENRIESNSGGNRINENLTDGIKQVKVKVLDDIFSEFHIKKLNLMKIDVEGYEMKVLLGAKNIIQKYKPKLFIEIDDNNLKDQKSSAQQLIKFLEENYYDCIDAVSKRQITSNDDFSNCHFDIICFHEKPELEN